jgi:hypothetical protein
LLGGRDERLDISLDTHVSREEDSASALRLDGANGLGAPLGVDIGDDD